MASLDQADLDPSERLTLDRFVRLVREEFGDELHGIWLYGSRARGERVHEDSDVDLVVVADRQGLDVEYRLFELLDEAADADGPARSTLFSIQFYDPQRLAQRREIESFFIQEVDRDKIVVAGEA